MKIDERLLEGLHESMVSDAELAVMGRFFTCDLLLGSGDRRFLLRFREGGLVEIGHFPMSENHEAFLSYVAPILDEIRSADRVADSA